MSNIFKLNRLESLHEASQSNHCSGRETMTHALSLNQSGGGETGLCIKSVSDDNRSKEALVMDIIE